MNARTFALAVAADAAFGDPAALPHPVRLFGFAIARAERSARAVANGDARGERILGFALATAIAGGTWCGASVLGKRLRDADARLSDSYDVIFGWTTIAARDLLRESRHVREALEAGDLARARTRVARIVGRDTAHLSTAEVARATIETLAESLCDGIVAPMLALALGGVPLALAFKAASTMDSMLGHIEEPYTHLGFAAAKLDDVSCWIPARLSGCAIALVAPLARGRTRTAYATMRLESARHASPNAGWPEAAMAGALGVRLGGANTYDGVRVRSPAFGAAFEPPSVADIGRAERIVIAATVVCAIACLGIRAGLDRA